MPPPLSSNNNKQQQPTTHSWRLSALHEKLSDLGAVHPIDLLDLDSDDVASLELKKLELKRWSSAMDELRQVAAEQGPSPLLSPRASAGLSPSAAAASPSPTFSPSAAEHARVASPARPAAGLSTLRIR
jgi:hypothetical protein